jgi:hypothetical protein
MSVFLGQFLHQNSTSAQRNSDTHRSSCLLIGHVTHEVVTKEHGQRSGAFSLAVHNQPRLGPALGLLRRTRFSYGRIVGAPQAPSQTQLRPDVAP